MDASDVMRARRWFLLRSTLMAAALPMAAATCPAHANKADKTDLAYRDKPAANGKRCSSCASFVAPRGCRVVDGDVSPDGWCIAYSEK